MRVIRAFIVAIAIAVFATSVMGCGNDKPSTSTGSTSDSGGFLNLPKEEAEAEIKQGSTEAITQEAEQARRVKRRIAEVCEVKSFDRPEAQKKLDDAYNKYYYDSLSAAYGSDMESTSIQTRLNQVARWTQRCSHSKQVYRDFARWFEGDFYPLPEL